MPKKILQEGELAEKIYPVATELIWLHISCQSGMIEEILHLVSEHLYQLHDSYTGRKPETPGSGAGQVVFE